MATDSYLIAHARDDDLPAVMALLRDSRLPEAGLHEHRGSIFVARAGERVVGCAALELYGEQALLRSVAVAEEWRGRGVGVRLTEAAIEGARGRDVRTLYLLTETATQFFPRFGFALVEREAISGDLTQSVEFTSACPSTAAAMKLDLTRS